MRAKVRPAPKQVHAYIFFRFFCPKKRKEERKAGDSWDLGLRSGSSSVQGSADTAARQV